MMRKLLFLLICTLTFCNSALAQDPIIKGDSLLLVEKQLKKLHKNVNFTVAPGPVYGFTNKVGFAVFPMVVYNLDKKDKLSPPSSTALMVYFDFYGSWQVAAKQSFYWNNNKWRAFIGAGIGRMQLKFFGVGKDQEIISNDPSNYTWVKAEGGSFSLSTFRKIFASLYGGLEYTFESSVMSADDENGVEALKLSGITSGEKIEESILVPCFVWDSRNNIFWTLKGYYAGLNLQFSNKLFFSSKDYSVISGWVNGYHRLVSNSDKLSLAWHTYLQFGWGELPYYRYSVYGRGDNVTGYTRGKYVNRSEITLQAELRYDVWKFLGAGGYLGTGKIFPDLSVFGPSAWLHYGGMRLYVNILPSRNIRIRFDLAFARQDFGFYVGVGQGF